MKFLVDRCAGRRIATWLRERGHDVILAESNEPDPGDLALLQWAAREERIVITLDSDFAMLVYLAGACHAGIVRLPDVPPQERIRLMGLILERHAGELLRQAIITVRGDRMRVSLPKQD